MQRASFIKMDFKAWRNNYSILLKHLVGLKLHVLVDQCHRLNTLIKFLDNHDIVFKLNINFFREADQLLKQIILGIQPLNISENIKQAISEIHAQLKPKLLYLFKHNQSGSSLVATLPSEIFGNIAHSLTLNSMENLLSTCGYFSHHQTLLAIKKEKIYPKWQISMGANHTVILDRENGRLYGVGANDKSQLGFNFKEKINYNQPILIPIPEKVREVAAGYNHTLALCDDVVYGFGNNTSSQLGLGEEFIKLDWENNILVPMKITLPQDEMPIKIATSTDHKAYSLIVCASQNLYVFGNNESGQLGLNDYNDRLTPTLHPFMPKTTIKEIIVGARHTFLVTEDGIYGFGDNKCGQLGLGKDMPFQPVPIRIDFEKFGIDPIQICTGDFHTLVLDKSGKVFGFGANGCSQLGLSCSTFYYMPHLISLPTMATHIKAKVATSFIFCGNQIYTFGDNTYGQLGLGQNSLIATHPQLLNLKVTVLDIIPGGYHSFIYCDNQKFYAAGRNCCAQLGAGSKGETQLEPIITNVFKDLQKRNREAERMELKNNKTVPTFRPY